ncbi:hypothetical protein [Micromonospora avicenniae]|uniref:hypothetical protein n=1 Tax=Micromonospora avicenniae TaxID=1198245 RepID=UPI00333180FF
MAAETRTLKVVVAGDAKGARYALKETKDDVKDVEKATVDADRTWSRFTDKVKSLGGVFRSTSKTATTSISKVDTKALDAELLRTQRHLFDLNTEFAKTGNRELFKKMAQDRRLITNLTKVRQEMTGIGHGAERVASLGAKLGLTLGKTAGEAASKGLGSAFSSLPPQVQLGLIAGISGAVATVAPFLGAIISGAVVGGIGAGGVIGGLAIASTHPAVKAAATVLGDTFTKTMQSAGAAFVPVTVRALDKITREVRSLEGDFRRIFSKAAVYVDPLVDGVIGFVENLLPGVERAVGSAGPIINELASWGPKLGTLLSDIFTMFSENAGNGARALAAFWTVFEWGIRLIAANINTLASLYGWFEKLGLILTGQISKVAAISAAQNDQKKSAEGLSTSLADVIATLGDFGSATADAEVKVETLGEAIRRIAGENLDLRSATRAVEEAADRAAEAFKRNGETLDRGTAKGRANEAALDEMARTTWQLYDATLKQTGSQDKANAVLATGRSRFIAMADKMGLTKSQAVALADKLFGIPDVDRDITVKQKQALDAIAEVTRNLKGVKSKNISIGVYWKSNGDLKVPGGTLLKNAEGGLIRGPGSATSDSIISRVSNGEYILRAGAVRKLGVGFLDRLNQIDRKGGIPGDSLPGRQVQDGALARRSLEAAQGGNGGPAVNVTVHVAGSVTAERNLAKSIALTVRDEIARNGKRNGGNTGV